MAGRKKQEIQLQVEIESQEGWEELLQKEGLVVVDVYQEWCGPCRAMTSFFRRIKNETGDDLLSFAVAKADSIDSLERYRSKCEPCFLFYGGGNLVAVVRGANPPVIDRTIRQKLDEEHKIMRGEKERVEIRDPAFAGMEEEEKGAQDEKEGEKEEEVEREVTFALIKPDAVAAGKVEEIMAKLEADGIEVLYKEERQLTEEEARSFYAHHSEEEFFDSLVEFMCSGDSVLLALAKGDEGVISEFRELIGPTMVEEAKEQAPDSLRATFGSESFKNAVHGADSRDNAARELAFFFPHFSIPRVHRKVVTEGVHEEEAKPSIQRTLALIRPDAYAEFKDSILAKIKESGFTIAMQKEIQLTPEQAQNFYKEHKGEEYFDELTTRMSSGPLIALALARQDAIGGWRQMIGPTDVKAAKETAPDSLRAQFSKEDIPINLLHGSDSEEKAKEELEYFFPMEQTLVAIKPDAYENRDEIIDKIKEAGFHVAARKETHLTSEMAREFYKDVADREYFDDLVEHMTSGSTLFMVLSREDAVEGWRSVMGATDPEHATEVAPDSLRAIFGRDVKENALHGSSTLSHAGRSIQLIFGDVEFDTEGNLSGGADAAEATVTEEGERGEAAAAEGDETHRSGLLDGSERVVLEAEAAEEGEKEETAGAEAQGEDAAHAEEEVEAKEEGGEEKAELEEEEKKEGEDEGEEAKEGDEEAKEEAGEEKAKEETEPEAGATEEEAKEPEASGEAEGANEGRESEEQAPQEEQAAETADEGQEEKKEEEEQPQEEQGESAAEEQATEEPAAESEEQAEDKEDVIEVHETPAPHAAEPEASAPQPDEPETSASQAAEPEASAPQPDEPETSASQAAEPETSAPQPDEPEAPAPQEAEPEASAPQAAEPEASAPQATEPEASDPQPASPEASDSKIPEDEAKEAEGEERPATAKSQTEEEKQSKKEGDE